MSGEHWEKNAANWAAWARKPDFDSYWKYAQTFFELVPPPGRRTLEVGCGEGRVSRDLAARGHHVFAVDTSPTLIRLAHDADASVAYVRCDAAALPFQDESFDLAVFYNSLMDFDDMDTSVARQGESCGPAESSAPRSPTPFRTLAGLPPAVETRRSSSREATSASAESSTLKSSAMAFTCISRVGRTRSRHMHGRRRMRV